MMSKAFDLDYAKPRRAEVGEGPSETDLARVRALDLEEYAVAVMSECASVGRRMMATLLMAADERS